MVCGEEGGALVEEGARGKRKGGGRSGTQGGVERVKEEHREEGEPGSGQRTKGVGGMQEGEKEEKTEEKEGKGGEGPHRSWQAPQVLCMGESQRTSWKIKRQQPETRL